MILFFICVCCSGKVAVSGTEIADADGLRANAVFENPLDSSSELIISMRWERLDEQICHFLFGAAIAYAVNRSIKVEMRRYPLAGKQPRMHLALQTLETGLVEMTSFSRLRIARELACKTKDEIEPMSRNVPLLVRNFEYLGNLYTNHFIAERLKGMFGMHAGYFLLHKYMDVKGKEEHAIAVEMTVFRKSERTMNIKSVKYVVAAFIKAVKEVSNERDMIFVMSNDDEAGNLIKKKLPNVILVGEDMSGFKKLVNAETFVGTYRSRMSNIVNMARGKKGLLVNTDTDSVVDMSNSQAGVFSPYLQDVEDLEFTVNEKLRGCRDNIDDLRDVLRTFVL